MSLSYNLAGCSASEMGNSNSGVDAFLLGAGVELELILLIRNGVGVELSLYEEELELNFVILE